MAGLAFSASGKQEVHGEERSALPCGNSRGNFGAFGLARESGGGWT